MIDFAMGIDKPTHPLSSRQLRQLFDSPEVAAICQRLQRAAEQYEAGRITKADYDRIKRKEKRRLPVVMFHAHFPDGHRSNASAVPSGLAIFDIDHLADPRQYYQERIAPRLSELHIVLAHVTPSARGLRLVFVCPAGFTIALSQQWMAEQLPEPNYDAAVKDLARPSYVVPWSYVLHYNRRTLFRPRCVRPAEPELPAEPAAPAADQSSDAAPASLPPTPPTAPFDFRGIPFDRIIAEWWRRSGGEPCEGERNVRLYQLAVHLRAICDNRPDRLLSILPSFGLDTQELTNIVLSACKETPRGISSRLQSIIQTLSTTALTEASADPSSPLGPTDPYADEPPFPTSLPPLIDLLTSRVPDAYKPAVACSVFPPLGAHLGGVTFRYIDNVEHEATLMSCLLAKMSAGKSCINKPIERILHDIHLRDDEQRRREQQWKDTINERSATAARPPRPRGIAVQCLSADMTNAAFVQRLADANGRFLYTQMDELELLDQLRPSSRTGSVSQIIRLAFDCGLYGQERVATQAVTARVRVKWNWNASSTISRARRFFRAGLTDGTISRISFCTIRTERGADMPVIGHYDDDFDRQLAPFILALNHASGHITCPQADRLARALVEENRLTADLADDEVYQMLSHRACVIAWLKAMVLYVAHGCRWLPEMDDFVRWSCRYDLWCKMRFFGTQMAADMAAEDDTRRPFARNLLGQLDDVFSLADASAVRLRAGRDPDARPMLRLWLHRSLIEPTDRTGYYRKTAAGQRSL